MLIRHRTLAVVTVATAALACGSATAQAAPATVTGGSSSITLLRPTLTNFTAAKVSVAAVKPATQQKSKFTFPHTGGTASPPNYRLVEAGGLALTHGKKRVTITKLVLNTRTEQITGTISGHQSAVVFVLGDPNRGGGAPGRIQFGGYPVSWSAIAAQGLNRDLGTTVFSKNHRLFGGGDTDVRFKD